MHSALAHTRADAETRPAITEERPVMPSIAPDVLDRMTKAQLIQHVAQVESDIAAMKAATPPAVQPVPEADALGRCVRALDTLKTASSNYNRSDVPDTATIDRLLRSLAGKYGVRLIEVREQPCSRPHLDVLDPFQIGNTVINNLGVTA